jgi:hypothetical protein
MEVTSPYTLGSAGGPIFDANGIVIGIATSSTPKNRRANLALPSNLLKSLPASDLTFASTKPPPLQPDEVQDMRDAVFADTILEGSTGKSLEFLFFSLHNTTGFTLCNFAVLISGKNDQGQYLGPVVMEEKDCVPSGNSKQVMSSLTIGGRQLKFEPGKISIHDWIVRILDFKVKRDDP